MSAEPPLVYVARDAETGDVVRTGPCDQLVMWHNWGMVRAFDRSPDDEVHAVTWDPTWDPSEECSQCGEEKPPGGDFCFACEDALRGDARLDEPLGGPITGPPRTPPHGNTSR